MAGGKWLAGLDGYDVTVRLLPGALVVAPLVAVGVAAGVRANPVVTIVIGLVGLGGISFALRAWVRSRGKLIEEQLEDERDGLPTRHALRVGGEAWSPAQRAKWRAAVAETTNMSLEDDDEIDAAVMDLRSRTRDAERYALVDAERRSYGYERNLLGVRRAGIATSLLSVGLGVMLMIVEPDVEGLSLDRLDMVLATVLSLGIGAFFVAYPRVDRVWAAGCDYAERLMEAAKPAPEEQRP
jgi:hypothetical protein